MKKIALLVFAILFCSLINAQEVKLSEYIKGKWESNTECIIARDTIIPDVTIQQAWILDNYGFYGEFKKFLWLNWYKLSITNKTKYTRLPNEFFKIKNVSNTGNVGEIIGKVTINELQISIDSACACQCLKNPSKTIIYDVIMHERHDGVDHMIWSPIDTTLSYNDKYMQSIFWYRTDE